MLLSVAAADYIKHARHSLGLTDSTCYSYQAALRYYVTWLETHGHPTPDVSCLSTSLLRDFLYFESARGKRPRGIHSLFYAIKALVVYLMAQGELDENPVKPIQLPKMDAPKRPIVSDEECAGLLAACDRLRSRRRQALAKGLFSTLIFTGLRAMEVLDLELDDVSFDRKTIVIKQGKGKKSRTLYPSVEAMLALENWINVRALNRKIETRYLFAYDPKRRIAYQGLLNMLHEVKLIAGYGERTHIQPHALRRAFATRLMEKGASIRAIQAAMGHTHAETTLAYLAMTNDAARPMADLASLDQPPPVVAVPHVAPAPSPAPVDDKARRAADVSRRRRTPAR